MALLQHVDEFLLPLAVVCHVHLVCSLHPLHAATCCWCRWGVLVSVCILLLECISVLKCIGCVFACFRVYSEVPLCQ